MNETAAQATPRPCLRCQRPMEYLGWRSLESAKAGGLFSGNLQLRVHKCGACGHVEFSAETDAERQAREEAEERARANRPR